jgi:maleylpyruvate isomerase
VTTAGPTELVDGVRAAHERLHATVRLIDDRTARSPSRLPGWTVGHVVTHLARNADSVVRRIRGAMDGSPVPQYAGGAAGRAAEIEAGAGRPAAELIADLIGADEAVDRLLAGVPAEIWDRAIPGAKGTEARADRIVYSRWREVEVHHVDLGLGYQPADWPAALVDLMLPGLLDDLPERADRTALAAWALDRAPAPPLRSWD